MNFTDYLIDSLLILMVLLQLKEKTLTTKTLLRPVIILSAAIANYLHGIPTAGNDLILTGLFLLIGGSLGLASGLTAIMHLTDQGAVTARAGWASATLWITGMGSRFAFIIWLTHTGAPTITHFSTTHHITTPETWTVALLAMAAAEVLARTLTMATRRQRLQRHAPIPAAITA